MDGAHGIPRDAISPANKLQQVLNGVGKQKTGNENKPNSTYEYNCRVIQRVNKEDKNREKESIQERYDNIFRPHQQEVKSKKLQACLIGVPKDISCVQRDQDQRRKEF